MADPAHPRWSLSRPSPRGGLPSLFLSWAVPPLATGSGIWVPTLLGAVAIVLATPPGEPGPADHLRPYTARSSWPAQTAAAGPPTAAGPPIAANGVIP